MQSYLVKNLIIFNWILWLYNEGLVKKKKKKSLYNAQS